jgi:DivIVA domain-containing protein
VAHGTIAVVLTLLLYLVIAAAIGLVVFAITAFLFGRGEQMAALSPRTSPAELPDLAITPEDVRRVRFSLALRGYRMSDVDWTLERLADEIGRLRDELAAAGAPDDDGGSDPDQEAMFPAMVPAGAVEEDAPESGPSHEHA